MVSINRRILPAVLLLVAAFALGTPLWANSESYAITAPLDPRPGFDYAVYLPIVSTARPPLLYVGMQSRWDGTGYIRLQTGAFDVGAHRTLGCPSLSAPDLLRCDFYDWYEPNPQGWSPLSYSAYYNVSTGNFVSSTLPSTPDWKWTEAWRLPYNAPLANGMTYALDGQSFSVSGPFSEVTAFGATVQFWLLTNPQSFLIWDGGGALKQYVQPGEAILRYDAGASHILLYSDILRRYYDNGSPNGDTVRYIRQLSASNALPGGTAPARADLEQVPWPAGSQPGELAGPLSPGQPKE